MLGLVVTLLCLAAIGAAAGIVFIAFGPVPVRRSVEMTPRMAPLPTAAAPVTLGTVPVFDPALATFSAPIATPPAPAPAPIVARPSTPAPVIARPPTPAPIAPRPVTIAPALAPVVRPRPASKSSPPPLPRTRSARGTANQHAFDDVATTRVPTVPTFDETSTSHALPLELDDTFVHDGN